MTVAKVIERRGEKKWYTTHGIVKAPMGQAARKNEVRAACRKEGIEIENSPERSGMRAWRDGKRIVAHGKLEIRPLDGDDRYVPTRWIVVPVENIIQKDPIPAGALKAALQLAADQSDEITGKGQSWLARQLDVSDRTVRRWVSGETTLDGANAVAVRSVLENHLE